MDETKILDFGIDWADLWLQTKTTGVDFAINVS